MNIAILIPCTSNKRDYTCLKETDLYMYFFKSFFTTYSPEHNYTIYLGLDDDDKFYQKLEIQAEIQKFISVMKNTKINIYSLDSSYKGDPAGIWTSLFKLAYNHNDYFVQCGSDIYFLDKNWIDVSIDKLKQNNNLGIVGLVDEGRLEFNKNDKLLTQSVVSKTHFDIFSFYFPKELPNWSSDDFLTDIYDKENLVYRIPHRFYNLGGAERYVIDKKYKENYNFCMNKYKSKIKDYLININGK